MFSHHGSFRFLAPATVVLLAGVYLLSHDQVNAPVEARPWFGIVPGPSAAAHGASFLTGACYLMFALGILASVGTEVRLAAGLSRTAEFTSVLRGALGLTVLAGAGALAQFFLSSIHGERAVIAGSIHPLLALPWGLGTVFVMFFLGYAIALTARVTGGLSIIAFCLIILLFDYLLFLLGMPLIFGTASPMNAPSHLGGVLAWTGLGAALLPISLTGIRRLNLRS
ncbi:MAG: hypothetical protein Q4P33_02560 [Flaviflexus sp.]|nr:hypothetical protein [Flaviflexus sp.]